MFLNIPNTLTLTPLMSEQHNIIRITLRIIRTHNTQQRRFPRSILTIQCPMLSSLHHQIQIPQYRPLPIPYIHPPKLNHPLLLPLSHLLLLAPRSLLLSHLTHLQYRLLFLLRQHPLRHLLPLLFKFPSRHLLPDLQILYRHHMRNKIRYIIRLRQHQYH